MISVFARRAGDPREGSTAAYMNFDAAPNQKTHQPELSRPAYE